MRNGSFGLVLFFACFGHAWFHLLVALFLTLVLVLEPVWRRPYDELIGLWTLGALLLGLAAPAAGWLSDRWGEARLMVIFFLGIGGATILCGLADGSEELTVALSLMGLFGAIFHPVGTAWVVKHATARGRAIAMMGICGSVGAAAASLFAAALAGYLGWRAAFIIPGTASVLAGVLLNRLLAAGRLADRRSDLFDQPEPPAPDRHRAFAVLAVTMSLTSVVYYAFTTMLPKWIEQQMSAPLGSGSGKELLSVGALVAFIYLVGATAQLVGGYFADRGAVKRIYLISYGMKLAALLCAYHATGWPVIAVAVVIIFVFDIAGPVESLLIARFATSRRRGLAYGIRNGIAIAAGPLGVQLVSLSYDDATGFSSLFVLLAGLVIIVLATGSFLPNDQNRATEEPADQKSVKV